MPPDRRRHHRSRGEICCLRLHCVNCTQCRRIEHPSSQGKPDAGKRHQDHDPHQRILRYQRLSDERLYFLLALFCSSGSSFLVLLFLILFLPFLFLVFFFLLAFLFFRSPFILLFSGFFFSAARPMTECCRVDQGTRSKTLVSPGWMDPCRRSADERLLLTAKHPHAPQRGY